MRAIRSGVLVLAAALALTGCASTQESARPGDVESAAFAPSLDVDLDGMMRSSSGLYHVDLRIGSGATARRGSAVQVRYTGWLPDGTRFEHVAPETPPVAFQLGTGAVIRGWDEGIVGMREGGVRRLVLPARLGYGARAVGAVPRNSVLIFDVELVEVR